MTDQPRLCPARGRRGTGTRVRRRAAARLCVRAATLRLADPAARLRAGATAQMGTCAAARPPRTLPGTGAATRLRGCAAAHPRVRLGAQMRICARQRGWSR
jgi:hypothetical protein